MLLIITLFVLQKKSTMAIVSGLLNTSVYRLDRTWRLVKKKHQTFHAKFETLVSASNRFELVVGLFVCWFLFCFVFFFCFVLFCFVCFVLFCFVLFCFVLFCLIFFFLFFFLFVGLAYFILPTK